MSDPAAAAAASLPTSVLATVKLVHVFGGIYIWEFVTSLDFEVEVYTRKRPWRWSLLVYIAARVLAMGAIITEFFGFDYPSEFNCNVWLRATLVFSFAAIMLSSLMILLRGVAVWGRSIYVVVFSSAIWLGNVAVAIWTMSLGEAVWFPPLGTCAITGAEKLRTGILVDLFADVILLTIMLAGVMNKRNGTGLWRVLYIQGLSWFLIAVCSKIPPIVMGFLNIDVGWNLMFNTPHLIIIVIVATRVYRELFVYITPTAGQRSRLPRPPQFQAAEAAMQVTVHKTVEFDVELAPQSSSRHEFGNLSEQVVSRGEQEAKDMYFAL